MCSQYWKSCVPNNDSHNTTETLCLRYWQHRIHDTDSHNTTEMLCVHDTDNNGFPTLIHTTLLTMLPKTLLTDLASMSNGASPLPVIVHHAVMLTGWQCFKPYRHSHCPSPGYHTFTTASAAAVASICPVGSQWIDVIVCCSQQTQQLQRVSKMHSH